MEFDSKLELAMLFVNILLISMIIFISVSNFYVRLKVSINEFNFSQDASFRIEFMRIHSNDKILNQNISYVVRNKTILTSLYGTLFQDVGKAWVKFFSYSWCVVIQLVLGKSHSWNHGIRDPETSYKIHWFDHRRLQSNFTINELYHKKYYQQNEDLFEFDPKVSL